MISAEAATGVQVVLSSSRQGLRLICPILKCFSNKFIESLEYIAIILSLVDKYITRALDKMAL